MQGTNSADGTDWALRIIRLPVPHVGVPSTPRSWAGVIRPAVACTPNATTTTTSTASPMRSGLHRWSEIRRCGGASARKRASRSRPSCFMTVRSWVGLATPRAAANASPISSGAKNRSARSYTRSASVRTASTSIMLARSTAWRHGDGRTCANATSMSCRCPSRTRRFAGLMSRCASPESHSLRTSARPSSMISSVTSASPISCAPSKNSVTSRYSRAGVSSTMPYGSAVGMPESRITRSV